MQRGGRALEGKMARLRLEEDDTLVLQVGIINSYISNRHSLHLKMYTPIAYTLNCNPYRE